MNTSTNYCLLICVLMSLFSCSATQISDNKPSDRVVDFNKNWRFSLNEVQDAYAPSQHDASWRVLDLPHDWSVEFPFDSIKGEGCTAYLPGGLGWYRKHFTADANENENVYILFDGVYNNSVVWVNGNRLGEHPYGYSPFHYDLTPYLTTDGSENVLAVKVDHTRYADSRWYTGSGIYRNVQLITVNKLHIPIWGTFVTTPSVTSETATVAVQVDIQNDFDSDLSYNLHTKIHDSKGVKVAEVTAKRQRAPVGKTVVNQQIIVSHPELWTVNRPKLYTAITSVYRNGIAINIKETKFGIRTIQFDKEQGFFLNNKNLKIKGVCLHHDGGLVGAAVPKGVWRRRFQRLKEAGCNAIRVAHNPASNEFLDLCDEMGFLVQDEFFDEWDYPKDKRQNMQDRHSDYITRGYSEHFQQCAESDLKAALLSHRNHPSVIQWSIGNEIEWTYPRNKNATGFFDNMSWNGNYFWSQPPLSPLEIKEAYENQPAGNYTIGTTAKKLAGWTRELDNTRPVVANCILPSVSFVTGYTDALDIVGFSYRRVMYDYARENYPNKTVMGTENLVQWHEWKAIENRSFISGTFLWTGIDYMGESNKKWPCKSTTSGMLDQAGFTKTSYHMYKALWTNEPHIYLCSQTSAESQYYTDVTGKIVEHKEGEWQHRLWSWYSVNEHWNYRTNEKVMVEVISNCDEVELLLNNKSLGTKKLIDFPDRIYKWSVSFASGKLVAKGVKKGETITTERVTTDKVTQLLVKADRAELTADGYDVAHLEVQLADAQGNPVLTVPKQVSFMVTGPLKRLGVDNGSVSNTQLYKANSIFTAKGKALLIVQSTSEVGKGKITVTSKGVAPVTIEIATK